MTRDKTREVDEETISISSHTPRSPSSWRPALGPEGEGIQERFRGVMRDHEIDTLIQESLEILSRCIDPNSPETASTGLVVGKVQSGKTTSFNAVTALARDNGFRLVIVVSGTTTDLFNQTADRLEEGLGLNTRPDRKWVMLREPKDDDVDRIKKALQTWDDPLWEEEERQTVMIVVKKNYARLLHLNRVLEELELDQEPVLVIDDEADQASLNIAKDKEKDMSKIYQRLITLRHHLPSHSYLQYTATPQAPLLINIIDNLSPDFAKTLSPGDDYTGGDTFFGEETRLVEVIPDEDIPDEESPMTEPPGSLLRALRVFYLGVSAGLLDPPHKRGNRSMMVHPSRSVEYHADFEQMVRSTTEMWSRVIRSPDADPDRQELIDSFRPAYTNLSQTVPDLPALEQLVQKLPRAIDGTIIMSVNQFRRDPPNWRDHYSYILIGGQKLDRGFTVEGLTVTYMPRGKGVGNIDTVQQRARFFGYKRSYIGYCRVWLEQEVSDIYAQYLRHESAIHRELIEHERSGDPLHQWKRRFFIDPGLQPTRRQVIDMDLAKGGFSNSWFIPRGPHESEVAIAKNMETLKTFLSGLSMTEDPGDSNRTVHQRHLLAKDVPLESVYESLLVGYSVARPLDSARFQGLLLQISEHLHDIRTRRGKDEKVPYPTCDVYLMSAGASGDPVEYLERGDPRERGTDKKTNSVKNLFQGASKDGMTYPGDHHLGDHDRVNIHIHLLRVLDEDRNVMCDRAPAITIWVPASLEGNWGAQMDYEKDETT